MSTSNNAPRSSAAGSSRFSGRTRLITAASVIAVGFAGAIAVGANLGILDAAESGAVGTVSAADLVPVVQTVDVYLGSSTTVQGTTPAAAVPASTLPTASSSTGGQEFAVDAAGVVTVGRSATGIRLDSVDPAPGWTWTLTQPKADTFTVTFTDGARTLEFLASVGPDGAVVAGVTEPVPAATAAGSGGGGEREGGEDEGGEHEYEGGGDDD